jgi:pimeloyl-ACP methyl ester carboxylesterase
MLTTPQSPRRRVLSPAAGLATAPSLGGRSCSGAEARVLSLQRRTRIQRREIEMRRSRIGSAERGPLDWYRNIDRSWELLAPYTGAVVTVPALYVVGDRDLVVRFPGAQQLIANLSTFVPKLRRTVMLPGCGHWTQQERAREVNEAMLEFLLMCA